MRSRVVKDNNVFRQKLIKSLSVKSIKWLRTAANLPNWSRGRLQDVSILMLLIYSVLNNGLVLKASVPNGKSHFNLNINAEATAADFSKQIVTVARAGTVVTGIAGGDFTGLVLAGELIPTLASTKIAYVRSQGGRQLIFVMNADGSEQSQLTPSDTDDVDPAWSPDGTRIIFASKVAGK
jgi:dipeptidyl aminopeptidase/acylaminoacyl peptidase